MNIQHLPAQNFLVWLKQTFPPYILREFRILLKTARLRPDLRLSQIHIQLARTLSYLRDTGSIKSIIAAAADLETRDSIAFQLAYHGHAYTLIVHKDSLIPLRDDLSKK